MSKLEGNGGPQQTTPGTQPAPMWWCRLGKAEGFLSRDNPLATTDQHVVEDRAMALLLRPELQRTHATVMTLFEEVLAVPTREHADLFPDMIDEYMFHHVMRAANGDPNQPLVARFMAPPHHWFGRDVPGSRWAGDCPDFIYRIVPIAHSGRYEVRGAQTGATRPICFYSLMSESTSAPQTLTLLEGLDMNYEPDGNFTLTVDESPAEGRRNHIQTKPGCEFLMIRDALGDWMTESPNALTVSRLDPRQAPKTEDQMVQHAMKIAIEGVYFTYYCMRVGNRTWPNEVRPPMLSSVFGGVATQWGTVGRLVLKDDEALVVRSNSAGAGFRNLQLYSLFQTTLDYWTRSSSINMAQMTPDEDGDFTYVIAHRDPGVANWLDMMGRTQLNVGQRWQGFTRNGARSDPWTTTQVTKFDDLDKELPAGVARIDAGARKAQLAARETGFRRRFIDS